MFYSVVFFSASVALILLGIGEKIVASAFTIAFGAAALALALAFGLGGKEVAAEYLKTLTEKKVIQSRKQYFITHLCPSSECLFQE